MASDGSDALARVRCPVLIIRRAEMPIDAQRLHELQPHAWIAQPVGTGHWMTISIPDQVNAVLDRFLAFLAVARPGADGRGGRLQRGFEAASGGPPGRSTAGRAGR
jgi:hypothetical protein